MYNTINDHKCVLKCAKNVLYNQMMDTEFLLIELKLY